ncbi:tetratricopeptide repeat protein [Microbulbifer discodermiae]|uniref:tetratricopeptide repeat protein n=1 Tax=Microbulbifer sp. 2201CG32-9 TaxID=3232309 RepID=UPI00345C3C10
MYRRSSDIFLDALDSDVFSIIKHALAEADEGNFENALDLLDSLVVTENPAALFYASSLSAASRESIEDFEERSIKQLKKSADSGYAPAIHELGVHYDNGQLVQRDTEKAAQLFRQAAEKGHPHAQWIHGLDLLHGSNGIEQDEQLGIDFVKKSALSKFEGALESLCDFYETGKYGFPVDTGKAQSFKDQINDQDVLGY